MTKITAIDGLQCIMELRYLLIRISGNGYAVYIRTSHGLPFLTGRPVSVCAFLYLEDIFFAYTTMTFRCRPYVVVHIISLLSLPQAAREIYLKALSALFQYSQLCVHSGWYAVVYMHI